jgi:AAA lid domain/ATPase family associated with various cellular activities (AAA)
LAAEQRRRNAGLEVRRRAWKNLVFTGGPGSGKSWTAVALGQTYKKLGVLSSGRVQQIAAADLAGTGPDETGKLVGEAFQQATGGILMINDAHVWNRLPARGDQVLRRLYENLNEYRELLNQEVAVILAGQAVPLRRMLHDNPPLAARFRAVIDFPGYTPEQLTVIVIALADEAGLRLTTAARSKAAAVLARAEEGRNSRNARLAVALVNQATAAQARRVAAESSRSQNPGILNTITDTDIPDCLHPNAAFPDDDWPGQYL